MKNYKGQDVVGAAAFAHDFRNKCFAMLGLLESGIIGTHKEALRSLYRDVDREFDTIKEFTSCWPGTCSFDCCYIYVEVSQLEAALIVTEIPSLPESIRKVLESNIDLARSQLEAFQTKYPRLIHQKESTKFGDAYFKERMACPFLINGRCAIYSSRPLNCRSHWVVSDPEICKISGTNYPVYNDDMKEASWDILSILNWREYPSSAKSAGMTEWLEQFAAACIVS